MSNESKSAYEGYVTAGQAPTGKDFAEFDELSPSAQAAWQAAVDAARDHARPEGESASGNARVAASTDPEVKNQAPTGSQVI